MHLPTLPQQGYHIRVCLGGWRGPASLDQAGGCASLHSTGHSYHMQPSHKMLGAQGLCKEGGRTHSHQATDHWHASVAHPTTCDECNSHGPAKPHTTEGDGALSSHSPSDAAARQGEEVLWFDCHQACLGQGGTTQPPAGLSQALVHQPYPDKQARPCIAELDLEAPLSQHLFVLGALPLVPRSGKAQPGGILGAR